MLDNQAESLFFFSLKKEDHFIEIFNSIKGKNTFNVSKKKKDAIWVLLTYTFASADLVANWKYFTTCLGEKSCTA